MTRIGRWMLSHLLWDTSGDSRGGLRGVLWALRKVLIASAAAALLTLVEWVEHHPPDIALVGVVHLVFMLGILALAASIASRFRGRRRNPSAAGESH